MPAVHTIPSQFYKDPKSLFLYLYQKPFFDTILEATNAKLLAKVPNAEPITMTELRTYFAIDHLAHPGFLKSSHIKFNKWWPTINDHAKIHCKKDLNLTMTRRRFYMIAKYLECGIDIPFVDRKIKKGSRLVTKMKNGQPVKIHDLNKKLDVIIDKLNDTWIKFKNPGIESRGLCLDESFRKTFSNWDQLKSYMPNKPDSYGQKFQCIVDEDFYLHKLAFDHSQQFARWQGVSGLIDFMIPDQYKYQGCTLTADNYYNTWDSLLMLHSQGTALIGTIRKNSAGKAMGHDLVKNLTKKIPKKDFKRKFELFERKLDPVRYGPEQYVQLGFFTDKIDKTVIMCTNDARLCCTRDQGHVSKILGPIEKPEIVKFYNNSKHYVDEMDRQLSHYSCARAFKNGNPIRRFISNLWDYCMHNCFVLFRKYHQLPINRDSKYAKMDRMGDLRSEFYFQTLFGLIGFKPEMPPLPLNIHALPNCGPFSTKKDCEITDPPHDKRTRSAYKCGVCQKHICKRDQVLLCPNCYLEKVN